MSGELIGFQTAPRTQIQAALEGVVRRLMYDLSFLHPNMPVYVSDSTLFEGQWVGRVIAPWMLSVLVFLGPDQIWPVRKASEKIGLRLPYSEVTFTVGRLDGISQYLSYSLMSPLSHSMSAQGGVRLTDDCARMLLSPPVSDPNAPQLNRRALLLGRWNCENA